MFEQAEIEGPQSGTIWIGDAPIDFLFQFNSVDKPLFVFFHGAVDQEKTVVPHFVGLSYRKMLDANLLHLSDSSLLYDNSIRSGWFLGCSQVNLPEVFEEIISILTRKLNSRRVVLFGSSGGGYPALYLGQVLPDCLSIVNSPATTVLKHPKRNSTVSDYLTHAFGLPSITDQEELLRNLKWSDLQADFNLENNPILYLLNQNDLNNIKHHAGPFFEQFDTGLDLGNCQISRLGNLFLVIDDWGPGHRYPPASLLKSIFQLAESIDVDWCDRDMEKHLGRLIGC